MCVAQVPVADVIQKYNPGNPIYGKITGSQVYALQKLAAQFASMVTAFCERLEFSDMASLFSKFQVGLL